LNAPFAPLRRRARNDAPQSLQLSSASKEVSRTFRPRAEAITLLSEIMARLHGLDMPVIQFIQISPEPDAAEVAVSFAQASATCLGRTLLARLGVSELQYQPSAAVKGSVATVTRRRTRKVDPDTLDIVPDSAVAGLCHARLGSDYGDASHATRALPESWLDNVALDFRLVVIGSDAPERDALPRVHSRDHRWKDQPAAVAWRHSASATCRRRHSRFGAPQRTTASTFKVAKIAS
jgi:hypothetical protein